MQGFLFSIVSDFLISSTSPSNIFSITLKILYPAAQITAKPPS
ncbi:hypothetical protein ROSI111154_20555 [Rouxiella silvae]